MKRIASWSIAVLWATTASAQPVSYQLDYLQPGAARAHVTIRLPAPLDAPASFVMPRGYPGGYSVVFYDRFVEKLTAHPDSGQATLAVSRDDDGPRWTIGRAGDRVSSIEYDVDLARMEQEILSGVESSKVRPGYAGLLGYSVFGYIDGYERAPITLAVTAPAGWPVLATLAPSVPAPIGKASARAPHFDALADSQLLMGPSLQLRRADGPVTLVMAVYAEAAEDLALETQLARTALDRVQAYYGDTPFSHYTVHLELLRPLPGHDYGFSQEHYDSGTFSLDVSRAMSPSTATATRDTTLFNYAHHMAHSWVPKRAYGQGYSPFTWELPPIVDTIWFNEGFGRYSAIVAVAAGLPAAESAAYRAARLESLKAIVAGAPPFIRRMPLLVLSREASFMYSDDFRIGRNVFSRGALMAAEMDDAIQSATGSARSLREALRAIVARTTSTGRAFTVEEFPELIQAATGVDVQAIFDRWMAPPASVPR